VGLEVQENITNSESRHEKVATPVSCGGVETEQIERILLYYRGFVVVGDDVVVVVVDLTDYSDSNSDSDSDSDSDSVFDFSADSVYGCCSVAVAAVSVDADVVAAVERDNKEKVAARLDMKAYD